MPGTWNGLLEDPYMQKKINSSLSVLHRSIYKLIHIITLLSNDMQIRNWVNSLMTNDNMSYQDFDIFYYSTKNNMSKKFIVPCFGILLTLSTLLLIHFQSQVNINWFMYHRISWKYKVMVGWYLAPSHYLIQCWPRFMMLYDVPSPQRVNDARQSGVMVMRVKKYSFQQSLLDQWWF